MKQYRLNNTMRKSNEFHKSVLITVGEIEIRKFTGMKA